MAGHRAAPVVQRRFRVFPGWGAVAGGFLGNGFFSVTGLVAIGLFIKPMSESLGWSRGAISVALSLRSIANTVPAPFLGPKIDAWGPRPFLITGAMTTGVSTAALAFVTELWQFYLLYGIIGAVALIGISNLVTGTSVSKWFVRRRGRALGLADLGSGIGVAVLIPLLQWSIDAFGWQGAWVALGALTTAVMFPAAFIVRRQPEDYGLQPDGFSERHATGLEGRGPQVEEAQWTRGEALRTPAFWLLLMTFNIGGLALMGVLAHQIPHITDSGFSQAEAATALSAWAVFSSISRVGFGFLAERFEIRYLIALVMAGSAAGVALLLWLSNLWVLYAFALVYGLFRGAYVLMHTIVWAEYFGRRFLGSIRGLVTPFSLTSSAGGPVLAGFLFDLKGDYVLAMQVFLGCYLVAAVLALLAKRPSRLAD